MQFLCEKKDFLKALSTVQKAINERHRFPALGAVSIKSAGQSIFISAPDLEIDISTKIEAEVKREGSITIPSRTLVDSVSFLKEGKLGVTIENGNNLRIKSQGSDIRIKGLSGEEFPELHVVQKDVSFSLDSAVLKNALEKTVFSCSTFSKSPVLTGVLMWILEEEIRFVGTDIFRLGEKKIKGIAALPTGKYILPKRTVQELCRILGEEKGMVQISVSPPQILFSVGGTEINSLLIEGNFPKYERIIPKYKWIIPKRSVWSAEIDKSELILAIKGAEVFARETITNKLQMIFQGDSLIIQTKETEIGVYTAEIPAVHSGEGETVDLNAQYLLDILQNLDGEKVKISCSDPSEPVVFESESDADFVHMIMPFIF